MMDLVIWLIIFLFGSIIGSFLNVCIFRIPKEESIVFPASHCGSCNTRLKGKDLVPIISFLALKGKCRYCYDKVSIQYPLIEVATGILFIAVYLKFGLSIEFFKFVTLTSVLLVIGIIDYKTQYVYSSVIITGIILGIIFLTITLITGEKSNLINVAIGALIPAMILAIIVWTTNGMGWGDVEIIFMIGIFLGLRLNLLNLFISIILGGVYAIYLIIFKKRNGKEAIAFGPYIVAATFITFIYGNQILDWYLGNFFY
ncbi:prepilin peptidase [Clostridium sardiniense]|uniref:prepilin peptidase n=1 Tax=Clostridium sardiniense TaxID=29369 RepID=UPI003D3270C4